jgi:hypothetical protein
MRFLWDGNEGFVMDMWNWLFGGEKKKVEHSVESLAKLEPSEYVKVPKEELLRAYRERACPAISEISHLLTDDPMNWVFVAKRLDHLYSPLHFRYPKNGIEIEIDFFDWQWNQCNGSTRDDIIRCPPNIICKHCRIDEPSIVKYFDYERRLLDISAMIFLEKRIDYLDNAGRRKLDDVVLGNVDELIRDLEQRIFKLKLKQSSEQKPVSPSQSSVDKTIHQIVHRR